MTWFEIVELNSLDYALEELNEEEFENFDSEEIDYDSESNGRPA